jgi:site-specific recombinase XerD
MNLQHYSPLTITEYKREIERFLSYLKNQNLQLDALQMPDIEDFIFTIEGTERTRNRTLSAIKSFYRFMTSRGIIAYDPAKAVRSIRVKRKNPVFLSEEEYVSLFRLFDNGTSINNERDKVLIALLLTTGIRVSEIIGLSFKDISVDSTKRVTLELLRKGQEMDFIYLNTQVSELFCAYLEKRKRMSVDSEKVFLSYRLGTLDRTAVYRLVKKYLNESGIVKNKKGPHILRHTFATTLMKKNISIFKIKELMNHKNITTTEKYLHVVEEDLKDVVEQIKL